MNKKGSIVLYIYLLIQLILFDIELSMTGFNKTFNRYTQRYYKVKSTALNEENYQEVFNHIEGLFYIFDVVCAWYPRKADCIHKTLLGYKFLRKKYSLPVDMVVGVRKFPFEAHAWLQINNQNFFSDNDETFRYNIILNSKNLSEG
ncbi:lasso peptide biosynthesis B2 protein [Bacillus subtilis]|uniref:Lasso peptide biosynthesis B2 protein n=1 Tax=Bacillus subtilis TaxID=1423 RepID=A0AAX3RPS0_BACIU|nr:lasso peptide biosynthesis B2 protein [Bacillus subtilis]WGD63205.1 lasso peptide biosynthesis B2 protein [Bacillus subtilis]WGD71016.1 lasso peptide biosynthesis B2 protein [Bacillus subtilis]WGD76396.1 lasso peptide biosynthesis B2 protein [Bacillus subtilis]